MEKVISVEQFNSAVEMITATPSEKAIFAYQNDPFVHRMVHCIKDAIRSNGVANAPAEARCTSHPADCFDGNDAAPEFEPCDVCGGTEADFDGFCPQCELPMEIKA